MKKLDLSGEWIFSELGKDEKLVGHLPGTNYTDLIALGKIEDPFWEMNELKYTDLSKKDYEYSRSFILNAADLDADKIELVVSGLDTFTEIYLNDGLLAKTDNAHRTWRLDLHDRLLIGENSIRIIFWSPVDIIKKKNDQKPVFGAGLGAEGLSYMRKAQYNFGWDWGPNLSPIGIYGDIAIEFNSTAKLDDIRILQNHTSEGVELNVSAKAIRYNDKPLKAKVCIASPDGSNSESFETSVSDSFSGSINILKPELWWSNGLGPQPLYKVSVELLDSETRLDLWERKIGLRTIELDTAKDQWGNNFCFKVNGVPIFAKGADWIPSDSFITRTKEEELEFYIKAANTANMNMLRIWGGGYYESDSFYELCDQYGILVWQDFAFACAEYPLMDSGFLESVHLEVIDNIKRLRHHASLALWCGNNEIQLMQMAFRKKADAIKAHDDFFFSTLKNWTREYDSATPYWAGSPSSGKPARKANSFEYGDTHLWQVWHGMMPIEAFKKYPTRFCSEFGMESLPSMKTVRDFTDIEKPSLFDPVIMLHQKSKKGNEKILFYLLAKYRQPKEFEDFIYLSQIVQSETIRMATEIWRRDMHRSHGSLYWQFNDCWPVASWASIDYSKRYKALQYRARHFNKMVCVSANMEKRFADINVINDMPHDFEGTLIWKILDLDGKTINSGKTKAYVKKNSAKSVKMLVFNDILSGKNKNETVLVLELENNDGVIISTQSNLLIPDKDVLLKKPRYSKSVHIENNKAIITIGSDTLARYVCIDSDIIDTAFSDNYFDINGNSSYTVTAEVPAGFTAKDIENSLTVKSLADVTPIGSPFSDSLERLKLRFDKTNFITWLAFKLIM